MNLQFNSFDSGDYKMPNNLELMIRKSGMLRKEVAERMGIRPETVSRHVSGALQFSIKQATEYAGILECNAQDILFSQNAVPLFGELNNTHVKVYDPSEGEISYHVPFPVDKYRRFVIAKHEDESKKWANGRMYTFSNECILKQTVDESSFMRLCIFKIDQVKQIRFGVIYPQPGGTYSVGNFDTHSDTAQGVVSGFDNNERNSGLTLSWCTPILSCVMQPDLLGIILKTH
jgi:hypothetical protein